MASQDNFDVLLVGAGFSGLYLLDRLREEGFSVRLHEAGAGLGGIWHWNCYPGARVDSTCAIYQYSREEIWREWEWSERFPDYREMRAYFEFIDEKLDLSRDIDFETRVSSANFDEAKRTWTVNSTHRDGSQTTTQANFFVICTGFGSKPYIPPLAGLDSFLGPCHHTALWPQEDIDMSNQRVAVIGTGASGVQVAQEAGKIAKQLTVYQRTPNIALPMQQQQWGPGDNAKLRETYQASFDMRAKSFGGTDFNFVDKATFDVSDEEREKLYQDLWDYGGFWYWLAGYNDMLINEEANRAAYDFWRQKVHARVNDPEIAEKLAPQDPPHPFGTKRPSLEQWYYDIFNQENVELVDIKTNPIEAITERGVRTSDGEREFDVIALATGFDAVTGGLTAIDIRGRDGMTLEKKWADGVRTYQGLANNGFPNLLVSYGPQAPTGFCNGPTSAEFQGDYIVDCLKYMRSNDLTRIEPTEAAEEQWRQKCLDLVAPTLFPKADSWYMGANIPGKPREILMYPGGVPMYMEELKNCVANGYAGYQLS
ncbi:MAG: NAD(P)/FAD-dependent oxidoreductase [Pseudomonadota bacterium]